MMLPCVRLGNGPLQKVFDARSSCSIWYRFNVGAEVLEIAGGPAHAREVPAGITAGDKEIGAHVIVRANDSLCSLVKARY
jgi:hypothetical protein